LQVPMARPPLETDSQSMDFLPQPSCHARPVPSTGKSLGHWTLAAHGNATRAADNQLVSPFPLDAKSALAKDARASGQAPEMEPSAIGPYRILAPLGRGGMGVVYRARHIGSERAVALKTVSVPAQRWLESIRREIHALTRIRHPGIVRIVDHGVDQGRPWYAMDLLEGETLGHFAERIWSPFRALPHPPVLPTATSEGPVDFEAAPSQLAERHIDLQFRRNGARPAAAGELRTVLRIVRRLCATLAFLHGEGFVNCDLKPNNVLLLEGQPVIIDFGLAAQYPASSGREALDAQRGASGTVPYMSPEQIRGEFVDARSDLYALGCILYELVVGSPPFAGAPISIRSGHLSQAPVPPSELVTDVPPALERLMLKLLDKDLSARFGYADEVAGVLAGLADDVHRLPDYPPPRSYLYRPRLVGREALVADLTKLRERAADGSGSLVLLAGESGVGKTRVAMEVTRVLSGSWMQTVTSESSLLPSEASGGASPLQAVRPLLQAIADHCQEGGPETTELLLGDRRSVLAQYEPLLAQVPAAPGSMPPPMPLAVDASRRRLFKYLSETLAAFARVQPLLWVIDDLGWADDLSLAFLQSLTPEYLEQTPVLILCTYRSEEATDAVTAIAAQEHVTHVQLPRLGQEAVSTMVGDMLALHERRDDFVEFVARQAEGNPFFVTEYLRAAISERVLYRDGQNSWQVPGAGGNGAPQFEALALPGSLREVIEQRLRRLSPAGQLAGLAAAVLGREADVDVVRRVASLSDEVAVGAVDELLRRQVLEQTDEGRVRFAHDKLREVAYAHAPAERIVALHARAANVLEDLWRDAPDANQHWATLGHHFAAAKLARPAAQYLKLAADHARATYANGDAIRLYREAIKQVTETLLALSSEDDAWQQTIVDLQEALGDLLLLGGESTKAREAYSVALDRFDVAGISRARIRRKVARTWEREHHHAEALVVYAAVERDLGNPSDGHTASSDWWSEFVQVQVDKAWDLYWLAKVDELNQLVERARPIVEERGLPTQRAQFFQALVHLNLRRDRYGVSDDTIGYARASVTAAEEAGDLRELALARFFLAITLMFHGNDEDAAPLYRAAINGAEQVGDAILLARSLTYYGVLHRRLGHVSEVRSIVERAEPIARNGAMFDYVGASQGNLSWVSWREGSCSETLRHATDALASWGRLPVEYPYPFQWLVRLPLAACLSDLGRIKEALPHWEILLASTQQNLPSPLRKEIESAIEDGRCAEPSSHGAARIIELAKALHYL
jgi:serine/threonine protein kinase/tetratricopeptide (TPR) repeat protein